jgi:predicted nucleotide-binding protein
MAVAVSLAGRAYPHRRACGTITGMSARDSAAQDDPSWLEASRLRVPLAVAQAALANMIERGYQLESKVVQTSNVEECISSVQEWQDYCAQWLTSNLGGAAAGEFLASVNQVTGYAWGNPYWALYSAARKADLRSERAVLASILARLPEWAEADQLPGDAVRPGGPVVADPKVVMVIYGHDKEANAALFTFLRELGLQPREWSQLIQRSGTASPYIGQVLEQAFRDARAVVAFFTPDERVRGTDGTWRWQARPNVLVEAGMALITHPDRTVFITLGHPGLPSDLAGRYYIQLDGTPGALNDVANQLKNAGCDADTTGHGWLDVTFPSRGEHQ